MTAKAKDELTISLVKELQESIEADLVSMIQRQDYALESISQKLWLAVAQIESSRSHARGENLVSLDSTFLSVSFGWARKVFLEFLEDLKEVKSYEDLLFLKYSKEREIFRKESSLLETTKCLLSDTDQSRQRLGERMPAVNLPEMLQLRQEYERLTLDIEFREQLHAIGRKVRRLK